MAKSPEPKTAAPEPTAAHVDQELRRREREYVAAQLATIDGLEQYAAEQDIYRARLRALDHAIAAAGE